MTAFTNQKKVSFQTNLISDVFVVERLDQEQVLELFYQPEDEQRFRMEKIVEEAWIAHTKNMPQQDSMNCLIRDIMPQYAPRQVPYHSSCSRNSLPGKLFRRSVQPTAMAAIA